jgi:ABC-type multidrug transport system fused ATPase/permease subunit
MNKNLIKLIFFWNFLSKQYRIRFIIVLIGMILSAGFEVLLIAIIVSAASTQNKFYSQGLSKDDNYFIFSDLTYVVCGISILLTAKLIFQVWQIRYQTKFAYDVMSKISCTLFQQYSQTSSILNVKKDRAILLRNTIREPSYFAGSIIIPILTLLTEVVMIMGIVTLLLINNPFATILVLFLTGLTTFFWLRHTKPKLQELGLNVQRLEAERLKIFDRTISATKDILMSNYIEILRTQFNSATKKVSSYTRTHSFYKNVSKSVLEYFVLMSIIILGILFLYIGYSYDEIISTVSLIILSLFRLLPSINKVTTSLNFISFNSATSNVLYKELKELTADDVKLNPNTQNLNWDEIRTQNISFSYENEMKSILKFQNFSIKRGKINIIMGRSGTGKSTFFDLMLGFLKPTTGSFDMFLNNSFIKTGSPFLFSQISYVSQENLFFDESIKANITLQDFYESKVDDQRLQNAVFVSQLEEVLQEKMEGLDYRIGDNGNLLSGGQQQRLAIARAIYCQPKLLLLDEATSALDEQTSNKILKNISKIKDLTTIMVSHNINHLKIADNLIKFI